MRVKNLCWSVLTFMVVVLMGMSFASCGSDDDDDVKKEEVSAIVGTWQGTKNKMAETLLFNSDGTCSEESVLEVGSYQLKNRQTGTYIEKDDKIIITFDKFEEWDPTKGKWYDVEKDKETVEMTYSKTDNKITDSDSVTYTKK